MIYESQMISFLPGGEVVDGRAITRRLVERRDAVSRKNNGLPFELANGERTAK